MRWAWIEIDTDAIRHNVAELVRVSAPAQVWAVVKANGYGHSAVMAANAALAGGATGLCVALVQEGVELRAAGVDAPILVLSEQPPEELPAAVANRLQLTVYRHETIEALAALGATQHPVHVKIDTGMHRAGIDVDEVLTLVRAVDHSPSVSLAGVFTHLAVADDPGNGFTATQIARFDRTLGAIRDAGIEVPCVHIGNSAGAIAHPAARRDMVRTGIAIYGIPPSPDLDLSGIDLRPALALKARVSYVRRVRAGEAVSYGLRHRFASDTTVAVLPLGYADGVSRRLFATGGEVLIGGRRCPIRGVVTMDQTIVEIGDLPVQVGDEAVLIGRQFGESISASEWAERLDTIGYEVVCALSARLDRRPV